MKVEMDRKMSKGREEEEQDPGAPAGSPQDHQDDPEAEENQKGKKEALKREGKVKVARIDS
jgi:hypothetical protein